MSLITAGEPLHFPAEAAEVFDVSGAGETRWSRRWPPAWQPDWSFRSRCGWPISRRGWWSAKSAPPWRAIRDLLAALSPQGGALRKIVTREQAAEQVERWRQRGWRTGFTNGCFDLLHPGHIHLLEQARSRCDRLVVGLNSDASVRRLKEARAVLVQSEAARAAVLGGIAAVDLVCVFDEDTPEADPARTAPRAAGQGRRLRHRHPSSARTSCRAMAARFMLAESTARVSRPPATMQRLRSV